MPPRKGGGGGETKEERPPRRGMTSDKFYEIDRRNPCPDIRYLNKIGYHFTDGKGRWYLQHTKEMKELQYLNEFVETELKRYPADGGYALYWVALSAKLTARDLPVTGETVVLHAASVTIVDDMTKKWKMKISDTSSQNPYPHSRKTGFVIGVLTLK